MPERTVQNLIAITSGGLSIATFPEIKTAVQNKYKEIYGSDIDLTNTTADGVFIENICLIINNILTTVEMLYSNMNIDTASGSYLDNLCALTGVYRKPATKSIASLELTNNSLNIITLNSSNNLTFVDKSGYTWSTQIGIETPFETLDLLPNIKTSVTVYCDEYGPISAPEGWINQLIDLSYDITINQPNEAILGNNQETDSELRARRNESISSIGLTTLNTLQGALLEISGIEDVEIYNNNTATNLLAKDETNILSRAVYIIIKKTKNVELPSETVGSRIYEKLTPGILTTPFEGISTTGISKQYEYNSGHGLSNTVYWKEASPITDANILINIKYKVFQYFSQETNTIIKNALKDYLNNLDLNKTFTTYDMIAELNDADPMFAGKKTYNILDVEIEYDGVLDNPLIKELDYGSSYNYQAKDTYFEIDSTNIINIEEV